MRLLRGNGKPEASWQEVHLLELQRTAEEDVALVEKMNSVSEINWQNVQRAVCIICDKQVPQSHNFCLNCKKPCKIVFPPNWKEIGPIFNVKSECCNADIDMRQKITCSNPCHEKFIGLIIKEYGEFKKVYDHFGVAYRVPTKDIIERGLIESELWKHYPRWPVIAAG